MIKAYSSATHYSASYLLTIKKNQKQLLKELQTDFLASKYSSESMSITGFLIKYKFPLLSCRLNYNKNLTEGKRFRKSESK
jgi:hypothetical protein